LVLVAGLLAPFLEVALQPGDVSRHWKKVHFPADLCQGLSVFLQVNFWLSIKSGRANRWSKSRLLGVQNDKLPVRKNPTCSLANFDRYRYSPN